MQKSYNKNPGISFSSWANKQQHKTAQNSLNSELFKKDIINQLF